MRMSANMDLLTLRFLTHTYLIIIHVFLYSNFSNFEFHYVQLFKIHIKSELQVTNDRKNLPNISLRFLFVLYAEFISVAEIFIKEL